MTDDLYDMHWRKKKQLFNLNFILFDIKYGTSIKLKGK